MSYQLFDPLTDEEYALLKADIAEHGVQVPILVDENGVVIDGHHRKQICDELGIDCPTIGAINYTEDEKLETAARLNAHRRQLKGKAKRAALARLIEASPEKSNRQIASVFGVSHHTAAKVRTELEATGQIAQLNERVGGDGKTRPASQPVKEKRRDSHSTTFETTFEDGDESADDEPIPHDPETGEVLGEPVSTNVDTTSNVSPLPTASKADGDVSQSDTDATPKPREEPILARIYASIKAVQRMRRDFDPELLGPSLRPEDIQHLRDQQRLTNEWFEAVFENSAKFKLIEGQNA